MAKPVKVRTSSGEWADLAVQVPSANEPTFTGTTSSSQFSATNSVGDEGGEIKFAKAATNTTLNTGVTLDVYQDKVRLFETAGTNRGGYFDMTTLGAGVSTNLAPGLTHINTTSFSAVSSISINNCFSSTYTNYRIILTLTATSAAGSFYVRLRASGSDNSTSNYRFHRTYWNSGGSGSNVNTSGTDFLIGSAAQNGASYQIELNLPFASERTYLTSIAVNNETSDIFKEFGVGTFNATTSFDGFSFYPGSGTLTGTVRVYGYRNS